VNRRWHSCLVPLCGLTTAVACVREASIGENASPVDAGFSLEASTDARGLDADSMGSATDGSRLPPGNVAGAYSVSLVNDTNDCAFGNFQPGNTTAGVPITVVQEAGAPANAVVTVGGFPAIFYSFVLGSADYTADVSGFSLQGILHGNVTSKRQGCDVTYDARIDASIAGDVIRGTFVYTSVPAADAGCMVSTCTSTQSFSGTKPMP
jgi:hypothetical protein